MLKCTLNIYLVIVVLLLLVIKVCDDNIRPFIMMFEGIDWSLVKFGELEQVNEWENFIEKWQDKLL